MALAALLRLIGFEPLEAATIEDGLRLLGQKPRCVILDLMLPDGEGRTILQYVRDHKLSIPVAVTTGAPDWQRLIGFPNLQADIVLGKPLDFTKLSAWLESQKGAPAEGFQAN